ncbi:TPA: hypothetical protein ACXRUV_004601 [Klebsiella quasipneumoniae subsp. similipneumoniae]
MQYYIISDDSYFLLGTKNHLANLKRNIIYSGADIFLNKFMPLHNDIVVLNVKNISLRQKIFLKPEMKHCRLIILMGRNAVLQADITIEPLQYWCA